MLVDLLEHMIINKGKAFFVYSCGPGASVGTGNDSLLVKKHFFFFFC